MPDPGQRTIIYISIGIDSISEHHSIILVTQFNSLSLIHAGQTSVREDVVSCLGGAECRGFNTAAASWAIDPIPFVQPFSGPPIDLSIHSYI